MSVSLFATRSLLRLVPKSLDDAEQVRRRTRTRAYPREAPLPASLRRMCEIEEWSAENQKVVTLSPHRRSDRHIIYLHGGAYISPIVPAHWGIIQALVALTGASVTVPFYALAPEGDHRPGTALVDAVYDRIAADRPAERIIVAGDSAGGNFALVLAIRRRDAGLSLPDRLVLYSPWLDLTLRDERARDLEEIDVMLGIDGLRQCGRWWAGSADPAAPWMSPLHADLAGLPPIAIFQGDHDIFVIDARTFAAHATAAGADCDHELTINPGHPMGPIRLPSQMKTA